MKIDRKKLRPFACLFGQQVHSVMPVVGTLLFFIAPRSKVLQGLLSLEGRSGQILWEKYNK